jgi:hypothetical protein
LGRLPPVEGKEEYADPSRKKRMKKGRRENFNILLFIEVFCFVSVSLPAGRP